jgi:hypothetical protein
MDRVVDRQSIPADAPDVPIGHSTLGHARRSEAWWAWRSPGSPSSPALLGCAGGCSRSRLSRSCNSRGTCRLRPVSRKAHWVPWSVPVSSREEAPQALVVRPGPLRNLLETRRMLLEPWRLCLIGCHYVTLRADQSRHMLPTCNDRRTRSRRLRLHTGQHGEHCRHSPAHVVTRGYASHSYTNMRSGLVSAHPRSASAGGSTGIPDIGSIQTR